MPEPIITKELQEEAFSLCIAFQRRLKKVISPILHGKSLKCCYIFQNIVLLHTLKHLRITTITKFFIYIAKKQYPQMTFPLFSSCVFS